MLMVRVIKKGRIRFLLLGLLIIAVILIGLYHGMPDGRRNLYSSLPFSDRKSSIFEESNDILEKKEASSNLNSIFDWDTKPSPPKCNAVREPSNDVFNTAEQYPNLQFNPTYKIYWNQSFEKKYARRRENWQEQPLKVAIESEFSE